MHTKGILIMTPDSAMVLTGKHSLDYSGGVSAEDNFGIGGYDRVMGPNGQAQYWAPNLSAACETLFAHYDHTYIAPGEGTRAGPRPPTPSTVTCGSSRTTTRTARSPPSARSSRPRPTPSARSPSTSARSCARSSTRTTRSSSAGRAWPTRTPPSSSTPTSAATRSRARDRVAADPAPGSFPPTAPTSGRRARCSRSRRRRRPERSTRASGNRPLVVLANLSGFDGSPESLRNMQLEYGAEIGRAIVNFDGPIVFCVISRYHGGAFVVFSGVLNDNMEVIAVEGSYASVIGGAPAAAVVFARDVNTRTAKDHADQELEARAGRGRRGRRGQLRVELADLRTDGPIGEARRGGGRVRAGAQHRAGARGRVGARDHPRRASSGPTSSTPSSAGWTVRPERPPPTSASGD